MSVAEAKNYKLARDDFFSIVLIIDCQNQVGSVRRTK